MSTPNNVILVTGGSGYFGSLLLERLRAEDQLLRNFDLVDWDTPAEDIEFQQGNICDFEGVRKACRDVAVVYHCVAQVPMTKAMDKFHAVNVTGTENLLKAALEAGVRKVVLVSSSAVFGIPYRNPVDQTVEPRPLEIYGQTKLEAEELAQRFNQEHGLDITQLRPRTIVGHGRLGIFAILFDWVADGKSVYVLGKGDNIYSFIHAEDLADACVAAAKRPGYAEYNIGAEKYCTMRETLEGLVAYAGTGSKVRSLPMKPAVWLMKAFSALRLMPFFPYVWLLYGKEFYYDISKEKRELNWAPKWGNVEMMCHSYDWYLAHRSDVDAGKGRSAHSSGAKQRLLKLLKYLP